MRWKCVKCIGDYHYGGVCIIDVPHMEESADGPDHCPWTNTGPYEPEWEPMVD